MNEQEILQQIATADEEYAGARRQMNEAKKAWVEAENLVIEAKIRRERLQEQLRKLQYANPNQPPTLRELEIEAFRERMGDLLDKV